MSSQFEANQPGTLLMEVVIAARRLLVIQSRLDTTLLPKSLSDAIERDFLLFDLQEAALNLRHVVEAAEVMAVTCMTGRSCAKWKPARSVMSRSGHEAVT